MRRTRADLPQARCRRNISDLYPAGKRRVRRIYPLPPMAMACQHQRQMGLLCRRPEHGTSLLASRDGRLQKPMGCTQSAVAENPGGQFYGNHETDIQPQSQIQGRAYRAGCHGYGLCRTNHGKYGARPYAFASHLPESG